MLGGCSKCNSLVNVNYTYINAAGTRRSVTVPTGPTGGAASQYADIFGWIQQQMINLGGYNSGANVANPYYIVFNAFIPTQPIQINLSNSYQVDVTPAASIRTFLGF